MPKENLSVPAPAQQPEAPAPVAPVVSVALPVRGEQGRLETILVRLPHKDKAAVKRMADAAGLSLSAWCRAVIQSVVKQAGEQTS